MGTKIRSSVELRLRVRVLFFKWILWLLGMASYAAVIAGIVGAIAARGHWGIAAFRLVAGILIALGMRGLIRVAYDAVTFGYRHSAYVLDRHRAYHDERSFFLYLRSFSDDVSAGLVTETVAPENDGRTVHRVVDNLSDTVQAALEPMGPMLFIGREPTDPFADHGIAVDATEANWYETFLECAAESRAIVIVPWITKSSLAEIKAIAAGEHLLKTVFIMRRADDAGRRAAQWEQVRETLVADGVKFPEYEPRGALFIATADGRWMVIPFLREASEERAIAGASEYLVGQVGGQLHVGLPFAEMLGRLTISNRLAANDSASLHQLG